MNEKKYNAAMVKLTYRSEVVSLSAQAYPLRRAGVSVAASTDYVPPKAEGLSVLLIHL